MAASQSHQTPEKTSAARVNAAEQLFRILLKFPRNVRIDAKFNQLNRGGHHEEVWIRFSRAWRDRHCGAVDCKRRDRRGQARRLSSRLRPARRNTPAARIRLASRMAS